LGVKTGPTHFGQQPIPKPPEDCYSRRIENVVNNLSDPISNKDSAYGLIGAGQLSLWLLRCFLLMPAGHAPLPAC
jgi:hypothetical protein